MRCWKIMGSGWTQTKHRVILDDNVPVPPPGLATASNLANKRKKATIVSNGSSYLEQELELAAWIIHEDDDLEMAACFLTQNVSSYTSYRSKLEGVFRSLLQAKASGMEDTDIEQWCNIKAAVDQTN